MEEELREKIEELKKCKGKNFKGLSFYVGGNSNFTFNFEEVMYFILSELKDLDDCHNSYKMVMYRKIFISVLEKLVKFRREVNNKKIIIFQGVFRKPHEEEIEREISHVLITDDPIEHFIYYCGNKFDLDELEKIFR